MFNFLPAFLKDEQAGKNAFLTEKYLRMANAGTTTYVNEVNEKEK